jgi:hypothetical protein
VPDYIFLMHDDTTAPVVEADWPVWFARLRTMGAFEGGSAIGEEAAFRKTGVAGPVAGHIGGFVRVSATDIEAARCCWTATPFMKLAGRSRSGCCLSPTERETPPAELYSLSRGHSLSGLAFGLCSAA